MDYIAFDTLFLGRSYFAAVFLILPVAIDIWQLLGSLASQ
jgi:hypothetical protein